jgi:hypothetical protein
MEGSFEGLGWAGELTFPRLSSPGPTPAVRLKKIAAKAYLSQVDILFIVILGLDPRIQGFSKQLSMAAGLPDRAQQ